MRAQWESPIKLMAFFKGSGLLRQRTSGTSTTTGNLKYSAITPDMWQCSDWATYNWQNKKFWNSWKNIVQYCAGDSHIHRGTGHRQGRKKNSWNFLTPSYICKNNTNPWKTLQYKQFTESWVIGSLSRYTCMITMLKKSISHEKSNGLLSTLPYGSAMVLTLANQSDHGRN